MGEIFPAEVSKVEGRIYQVQHVGELWALVEKPGLNVLVEEARLWEVHGKDILDAHDLLEREKEKGAKLKRGGTWHE